MRLTPIRLREAQQFVLRHHRHNKPPRGWLFGTSLRAVGWVPAAELQPRGDWAESSVKDRALRDPAQGSLIADERAKTGGVARIRWEKRA
jgi:hypothetical protein